MTATGPPPSSANHRPLPPTTTREVQHCRFLRTSLLPLFLRFAWLLLLLAPLGVFGVAASFGCTFKGNVPLPLPLPLALALRHLLEVGRGTRFFHAGRQRLGRWW